MRQFKPKRDFFRIKLYLFFIIPIIVLLIIQDATWKEIVFMSILLVTISVCKTLLMFHTSSFIIEGNILKCKVLAYSEVINITNIKKLEVGKTNYISRIIATGDNGITIVNNYEKIYLAPENNQEMVQALLEINPDIQVIDYTKKQAV